MPIVSTMPIFSAISIILLVANSDANKTPDSAKISAQFLVGVRRFRGFANLQRALRACFYVPRCSNPFSTFTAFIPSSATA